MCVASVRYLSHGECLSEEGKHRGKVTKDGRLYSVYAVVDIL